MRNILSRAQSGVILAGREFGFATAEDPIIQKVAAHRTKDWLDVEGILGAQQDDLDFDDIEDLIRQFAELLGEPQIFEKYLEMRESVRIILAK